MINSFCGGRGSFLKKRPSSPTPPSPKKLLQRGFFVVPGRLARLSVGGRSPFDALKQRKIKIKNPSGVFARKRRKDFFFSSNELRGALGTTLAGANLSVCSRPDKSQQGCLWIGTTTFPFYLNNPKTFLESFLEVSGTWLPKATCAAMELAPCLPFFSKKVLTKSIPRKDQILIS